EDKPPVERAQDLVDTRARPDLEERRLLELRELAVASLLGLFLALAGSRAAELCDHLILQIDRGVLRVVIEVLEILRVEDGHRNRLQDLAFVPDQKRTHQNTMQPTRTDSVFY